MSDKKPGVDVYRINPGRYVTPYKSIMPLGVDFRLPFVSGIMKNVPSQQRTGMAGRLQVAPFLFSELIIEVPGV